MPLEPDKERDLQMVAMLKDGLTMQDIGHHFGISRERVRQCLKRNGLTARNGSALYRGVAKLITEFREHAVNKNARSSRVYSAPLDEVMRLNRGLLLGDRKGRACGYVRQKSGAARRGIDFLLTFPEWCAIWDNSGKWELRGVRKGQYVMARMLDIGPYAVGNVQIVLSSDNVRQYFDSIRARGVMCSDGRMRLPESKKLMSGS